MKHTTTILTAALVAACLAGPALADTCTFVAAEGVWNIAANWTDCSGLTPDANDTAVIPNGKTCKIPTGGTNDAKALKIEVGGTLWILGSGRLNLHGDATETSILKGELLFVGAGGMTCVNPFCDPQNPLAPGVLFIENDLTITTSQGTNGLIEGVCRADSCLNPGLISGAPGVTLTLDMTPTGVLTIKNFVRFDVALDLDWVSFQVDEVDQLMEFNEQVDGNGKFLIKAGKVQVDSCMVLKSGHSGFELTNLSDPELEINADTCAEGFFKMSEGTLNVNANLTVRRDWRIGRLTATAPSEPPPLTINVALGKVLRLPGTAGNCTPCP